MRTALGFAAALVVGGGAVAAGAAGLAVPATWYGSDTLQDVTWSVLGGEGFTGDTLTWRPVSRPSTWRVARAPARARC